MNMYRRIGLVYKWLPYLALCCFLVVIYIGNVHSAEKKIRKINHIHKEIEEVKREYISIKHKSMYNGTLYQVAEKVNGIDLKKEVRIPKRIEDLDA